MASFQSYSYYHALLNQMQLGLRPNPESFRLSAMGLPRPNRRRLSLRATARPRATAQRSHAIIFLQGFGRSKSSSLHQELQPAQESGGGSKILRDRPGDSPAVSQRAAET